MAEYLVTWQIDFDGDTPDEAATLALMVMRDPESTALNFRVTDKSTGVEHDVDLDPFDWRLLA